MRLLRPGLAALIVLFATAQSAPPGFPKRVDVPMLQMTGVDVLPPAAPPAFTAKKVAVASLQMTGVDVPKSAPAPATFTAKKITVSALVMTGVN